MDDVLRLQFGILEGDMKNYDQQAIIAGQGIVSISNICFGTDMTWFGSMFVSAVNSQSSDLRPDTLLLRLLQYILTSNTEKQLL